MTELNMKDAIIGVEYAEWNDLYQGVLKVREQVKVARLAANPEKKQIAIEKAELLLDEILKRSFR